MKTIFCLVSRQAMANVLPVLMFRPENVVLFTTPEEKSCADHLQKLFNSKGIKVQRNDGLDAYNYIEFKEIVKMELSKTKGEVWLNVTGGTKLMALAAYEAFAEKNKPIIYCNTDRNQLIHLFPKLKTEKLQLEIKTSDYLQSYGYKVIGTKTELASEEYFKLFDLLQSQNLLIKFSNFLDSYRSQTGSGRILKTYFDKKEKIFSIQKTANGVFLFVDKKKFKYNDEGFLKGKWLEYFVMYLLKKQGINADVGVKIVSENNVENEIDLTFIQDYKLFLISCKTGKNTDPNSDIYEIETLRNLAGGTFGKGFLVTTRELSPKMQKRAENLGIKILTLEKLNQQGLL